MTIKLATAAALTLPLLAPHGFAVDGWSTLDAELSGLQGSLQAPANSGPKVSGWLQTSLRVQQDGVDTNADTVGDADELGFLVDQIRFHITGSAADGVEYKVGFDLLGSGTDLQDAYLRWTLDDGRTATGGRFLRPTLKSGMLPKLKLLFLQRTRIGGLLYRHDLGAMAATKLGQAQLTAALTNGADDTADDLAATLHLGADLLGKGAGTVEGAYGAPEGRNLYASVFAHDDASFEQGSAFGAEAHLVWGPFALSAEVASFGDDLDYNSKIPGEAGTTPYTLTASCLLGPESVWEVALRYEDYDDAMSRSRITAGVNRYLAGHNLKWTLQYLSVDSDSPTEVQDEVALGATLAF